MNFFYISQNVFKLSFPVANRSHLLGVGGRGREIDENSNSNVPNFPLKFVIFTGIFQKLSPSVRSSTFYEL